MLVVSVHFYRSLIDAVWVVEVDLDDQSVVESLCTGRRTQWQGPLRKPTPVRVTYQYRIRRPHSPEAVLRIRHSGTAAESWCHSSARPAYSPKLRRSTSDKRVADFTWIREPFTSINPCAFSFAKVREKVSLTVPNSLASARFVPGNFTSNP